MAATAISYSQLAKLWTVGAGLGITLLSGGGNPVLRASQNQLGVQTMQEDANGNRTQSGSLLVESGSTTLFANSALRRVGIRTNSPKVALEIIGMGSGSALF